MRTILISLLFISSLGYSQTLSVKKDKESVVVKYIDESRDMLYQNIDDNRIELIYTPMDSITFTIKEYDKFVKDVKKTAKWMDYELKRKRYILNAYPYAEDAIYVFNNETEGIGKILINQINKL